MTTTTKHQHKAETERTMGWTHCVVGGSCSGGAHGGVVFEAPCKCGAVRRIESNGQHRASSGWVLPGR